MYNQLRKQHREFWLGSKKRHWTVNQLTPFMDLLLISRMISERDRPGYAEGL
jgi:hypothetical protein